MMGIMREWDFYYEVWRERWLSKAEFDYWMSHILPCGWCITVEPRGE